MRHETYRQWLSLSIYGELSPDQETLLQAHLEQCDACRREIVELRTMLDRLKSELPEPPIRLLAEARAQLRRALRANLRSPSIGWRRFLPPLAVAASLLLGLFIGRASVPAGEPPEDWGEIANIRFLDDGASGEVEVSFDAIRTVNLRAAPSDPRIQAVLLEAMRSADNPGTRIRAVSAVEEQFTPAPNSAVKRALLDAVKYDGNVGVRRQALSVLARMPRDAEIRQALIDVLIHDENPGLRVSAVSALEADALNAVPLDEDTLGRLQQHLEDEKNNFIRLRSEAWLQEVRYQ